MSYRMSSDRERDLAQAMHDALTPLLRGRTMEEIWPALLILVLAMADEADDPREAAESLCEAARVNFLNH